ncbi:MAG: sugar-binding protein [Catalinimonas sp.]
MKTIYRNLMIGLLTLATLPAWAQSSQDTIFVPSWLPTFDSTFFKAAAEKQLTVGKLDPNAELIEIDGDLDDVWDSFEPVSLDLVVFGGGSKDVEGVLPEASDISASYRVTYDDNGLYFFVDVTDDLVLDNFGNDELLIGGGNQNRERNNRDNFQNQDNVEIDIRSIVGGPESFKNDSVYLSSGATVNGDPVTANNLWITASGNGTSLNNFSEYNGDLDFQYVFSPTRDTVGSGKGNEGNNGDWLIEYEAKVADGVGYTVEIFIPFANAVFSNENVFTTAEQVPNVGDMIGFNVMVSDNDENDEVRTNADGVETERRFDKDNKIGWASATNNNYAFASYMGTMMFGEVVLSSEKLKVNNASIFVSPNPTEGSFSVKVENAREASQVTISNVMGQKVLRTSMAPGTKQISFDASEWTPGVYMVRVVTGNTVGVKRVVVR